MAIVRAVLLGASSLFGACISAVFHFLLFCFVSCEKHRNYMYLCSSKNQLLKGLNLILTLRLPYFLGLAISCWATITFFLTPSLAFSLAEAQPAEKKGRANVLEFSVFF